MEHTLTYAYSVTFPERVERIREKYKAEGDNVVREYITNFASGYAKGKLVNSILTYMQVPTDVLNAPLHQKAINKLAVLMVNSKSERIQLDAATELIKATKGPEVTKMQVDLAVKNDSLEEFNNTLKDIAMKQVEFIESGTHTVKDMGALKVREIEYVEGVIDE
jgi:hypothetical protein